MENRNLTWILNLRASIDSIIHDSSVCRPTGLYKVRYKAEDLTSRMESRDMFSRLCTFIAFHGQLCAKVYLVTSVPDGSFQASRHSETCDSSILVLHPQVQRDFQHFST